MYPLYLKEIRSFLSSLVGYVAISVFVTLIGLFMWVIPTEGGGYNVLDNGFANIDPLFVIAPWVYLFLVPAITMRSFSEEKRAGTIELLLTRPLTDLRIVSAKFLAGLTLTAVSLVPTLVYYYSVHMLGSPKGNIDTGGMWGSYAGLLFLGAGFVSIGVFASAVSENQVIAFILAVLLCFLCYIGFEFVSAAGIFGDFSGALKAVGMNDHYLSMSRGVLDTRDMLYFVSLTLVFIFSTRLVLESRKW
jgi:ABC-2 type transport system permease protein